MFAGISTSVFEPFFIMSFAVNLSPEGSPATLTVVCESASAATGHWRYTPHITFVEAPVVSASNPKAPTSAAMLAASSWDVVNFATSARSASGMASEWLACFAMHSSPLYQPMNTHPLSAVALSVTFLLAAYAPAPDTLPVPVPSTSTESTGKSDTVNVDVATCFTPSTVLVK